MNMNEIESELSDFKATRRLLNEDKPTHEMSAGSCTAILFLELRQINQTLKRIANHLDVRGTDQNRGQDAT